MKDEWGGGLSYEQYVGRWSRRVALEFIAWLNVPGNCRWLDVGCGTGALSQTILDHAHPREVVGVDPSEGFTAHAREHIRDHRAHFQVADVGHLPITLANFDVVVSGLALNFFPPGGDSVSKMRDALRPDGIAAAYVWDYADGMQFMRYFWEAAAALDPGAIELDEGRRFPVCHPHELEKLFHEATLSDVATRGIEIETNFAHFDDFWQPFLGGQGPAPSYVASLTNERRHSLRERLRTALPHADDGSIVLTARAWAVKGTKA